MLNSATKNIVVCYVVFCLVRTYPLNANNIQPNHHVLVNENELDQAQKIIQS